MPAEQLLSRPLHEVVRNLSIAIAEGQTELDRRTISLQKEMQQAVESGELDYVLETPWYRFSEVDLDVTFELTLKGTEEVDEGGTVRAYRPMLVARPTKPQQASRDYDAELGTDVSIRLIPTSGRRLER